jgi:hypothetical protein
MSQTDLTHFRDEELLGLARNPAAQARQDAIRLLVERGSQLATHPDIVDEAAAFIHNEPRVLKKVTPLANFGSVLPGVVDVVVRTIERTGQLESRAVQIEATARDNQRTLTETDQQLRAEIGKSNAQLGNVDARHEQAHNAFLTDLLDLDARHEQTRSALSDMAGHYSETVQQYEQRLARLERSPARKLYDWVIVPPVRWVGEVFAWLQQCLAKSVGPVQQLDRAAYEDVP